VKFDRFEDIIAWKKAKDLTSECYKIFTTLKDYSFKDQILRAVLSIMNNIAEGFERMSNKDFKNFLFIAKGSCGEVRSMLYIALERRYITEQEFNNLYNKSLEISKILSGLIKTL